LSEGPRTPTPSRPALPTGPSRARPPSPPFRPACPPACHAAPLHAPARPSTPLHARPHARAQLMTSITSSRVKSDPLDETRPMSDGRSTRPATHLRCIPVALTQPEAALLPPPLASSLNTSRGAPKLLPRLPSCLHPWRLALPGGTASCARLLQGVGAGHAAFHLATYRRRVAPLMPLLLLARSTLPPPAHPPPGLHTLPRGSEDTNIDPANRKCSDRIRYSTNSDPRASPHPQPAPLHPPPSRPAPAPAPPHPSGASKPRAPSPPCRSRSKVAPDSVSQAGCRLAAQWPDRQMLMRTAPRSSSHPAASPSPPTAPRYGTDLMLHIPSTTHTHRPRRISLILTVISVGGLRFA
jgi:hypothetical protein